MLAEEDCKTLIRLACRDQCWTNPQGEVNGLHGCTRKGGHANINSFCLSLTTSARFRSSGVCAKQPASNYSQGFAPETPPETARCRGSTGGLLCGRRLARGRTLSVDEGVQDANGAGEPFQYQQAGTSREAGLALVSSPLPLKRWRVEIEAVYSARAGLRAGIGISAKLECGPPRLASAFVFSGMSRRHLCLSRLTLHIGSRCTKQLPRSLDIERHCLSAPREWLFVSIFLFHLHMHPECSRRGALPRTWAYCRNI